MSKDERINHHWKSKATVLLKHTCIVCVQIRRSRNVTIHHQNHLFHFLDSWFIIFNHEHILCMQIRLSIFMKLELIKSFSASFCKECLMRLLKSCYSMFWWLRLLETFDNVTFMFFTQDLQCNLQIIFEFKLIKSFIELFWLKLMYILKRRMIENEEYLCTISDALDYNDDIYCSNALYYNSPLNKSL